MMGRLYEIAASMCLAMAILMGLGLYGLEAYGQSSQPSSQPTCQVKAIVDRQTGEIIVNCFVNCPNVPNNCHLVATWDPEKRVWNFTCGSC